jgi:hypothetical protein
MKERENNLKKDNNHSKDCCSIFSCIFPKSSNKILPSQENTQDDADHQNALLIGAYLYHLDEQIPSNH